MSIGVRLINFDALFVSCLVLLAFLGFGGHGAFEISVEYSEAERRGEREIAFTQRLTSSSYSSSSRRRGSN